MMPDAIRPVPAPVIPPVVAAWKSAGTSLAAHPDDALAEDWNAVGFLLAGIAEHGKCGAWDFDPFTQKLTCSCGTEMFPEGAAA